LRGVGMYYKYKKEDILQVLNALDKLQVKGIDNISALLFAYKIINQGIPVKEEENKTK